MAKIFCEPGDLILTEAPTYVGALGAFDSFQAEMRSVATDGDGMHPRRARRRRSTPSRPKDGARSSSISSRRSRTRAASRRRTPRRRSASSRSATRRDLLIVEDNPYAQVRFEGEPVPALRSLTDEGIIYLGTLSKVFSPGMRIGWVLAPETVRERLVLAKEAADLCSSPFTQLVAADYLGSGHVDEDMDIVAQDLQGTTRHDARRARRALPVRGDDASARGRAVPLGDAARIRSTRRRCSRGRSKPARRTSRARRSTRSKRDGRTSMRLNFSYPSVADIEEGMRRLGAVVTDELDLARTAGGLARGARRRRPRRTLARA